MKSKHSSNMSVAMMRKALRAFNGVQAVSNFRPTAAGALYQRFAKMLGKDSIATWDMSGGFGGRLLGAIMSGTVHTYIANEPSTKTFVGLQQMTQDFAKWEYQTNTLIVRLGSEAWFPNAQLDLVMTSPPYFNTERYSDEPSQSYLKFPTYAEWIEGFFRQSINNAHQALSPKGLLAINVANVATAKILEDDALKIMQNEGFELVETLKLKLSGRPNKQGQLFKYEPIFVMKKSQ
jgi:tRNA1(Val) A37 N6-methylase TrmN6